MSSFRHGGRKEFLKQMLGSLKELPEQEKHLFKLSLTCMTEALNENEREKFQKEYAEGLLLFTPLHPLPKKQFQESYNMWKAKMSLNFNFWRLRRNSRITLQPLEEFPDFITKKTFKNSMNCFDILTEITRIFFLGMDVVLLDGVDIEKENWKVKSRSHPVINKKQYLVGDIHRCLRKYRQKNTYCALGINWTDYYPQENLNFVLGEASGTFRVGAFCFGRYEPRAYVDGQSPPEITAVDGELLWKMIKVVTHETCHIFGLGHCFYFECSMNESKAISEAMSQPFYLCPVCVKKLQKVCKFRLVQRYHLLRDFLNDLHCDFPCDKLRQAAEWYENCLAYMESNGQQALQTHL